MEEWAAGFFLGAALATTLPVTYCLFFNGLRPLTGQWLLLIPIAAILNLVAFLTAMNLAGPFLLLGPFYFACVVLMTMRHFGLSFGDGYTLSCGSDGDQKPLRSERNDDKKPLRSDRDDVNAAAVVEQHRAAKSTLKIVD